MRSHQWQAASQVVAKDQNFLNWIKPHRIKPTDTRIYRSTEIRRQANRKCLAWCSQKRALSTLHVPHSVLQRTWGHAGSRPRLATQNFSQTQFLLPDSIRKSPCKLWTFHNIARVHRLVYRPAWLREERFGKLQQFLYILWPSLRHSMYRHNKPLDHVHRQVSPTQWRSMSKWRMLGSSTYTLGFSIFVFSNFLFGYLQQFLVAHISPLQLAFFEWLALQSNCMDVAENRFHPASASSVRQSIIGWM